MDDVDEEKVKWFLNEAKRQRGLNISEVVAAKDVLVKVHLLKKSGITNAAILLFGKEPQRFYLQAEVKCAHFHGTVVEKPFETYHIYKGNIFKQVDDALDFVLARIRRQVIPEPGKPTTKRLYEIPEFVIREAIVNAIVHREYSSTAGVQMMVFADRIEVWNSGKLPLQLTPEDLREIHPSVPHNPLIAEIFYLARYIEKAGSGTNEMIEQCRSNRLPEPIFEQKMGFFVMTIWRSVLTDEYLDSMGLNERQKNAVKYIMKHDSINRRTYCRINNIGQTLAYRDLTGAEENGILERRGQGRSVYYVLRTKRTISERLQDDNRTV